LTTDTRPIACKYVQSAQCRNALITLNKQTWTEYESLDLDFSKMF